MKENTINADVTLGGSEGVLLANRYRVVRPLGQGGMGSVWLAADTQLDNREVAIKMLPSILVSNKRAYTQLKAEALVSLKLTHPNIAAVRAFEENGGNPFLVVDYIDGVTLDDYLFEKCDAGREASMRPPHVDAKNRSPVDAIVSIASDRKDPSSSDAFETNASTDAAPQSGGLPESEVIRLLTPIAAALDYAHSKGVVHRDVKPGNVMIAKDGTAYILDFGIAREIQETMTRVTGKLSSGTLMYMSPEQLHGAAPKSSQDVYSFAAMAYECLMGKPPFSRGQIEYQIEHDSPAPIDPQVAKCGAGIMAGLAKSPEDRPTNCAAVLMGGTRSVASDSGRAASTRPPQNGMASDGGRARAPREPRRWGMTGATFLVIAAVCGACYVWYQGQQDSLSKQAKIARLAEEKKALEAEKAEAAAKREREERAAAETDRKERIETEKVRLSEAKRQVVETAALEAKRKQEAEAKEALEKAEVEKRIAEQKTKAEAEKKRIVEIESRSLGTSFVIGLNGGVGLEMRFCNGGEYLAGASVRYKQKYPNWAKIMEDEHKSRIGYGFWVGTMETSQRQWGLIMQNTGVPLTVDSLKSRINDDHRQYVFAKGSKTVKEYYDDTKAWNINLICGEYDAESPVYFVSWEDAVAFCERLTSIEKLSGHSLPDGYVYRLPTEKEWEYACRGRSIEEIPGMGNVEVVVRGSNRYYCTNLDQVAWYMGNAGDGDSGIGKYLSGVGNVFVRQRGLKKANDFGIYDMLGNVCEWCIGDRNGSKPVRGGSWSSAAFQCVPFMPGYWPSGFRSNFIGFRVVLAPKLPVQDKEMAPAQSTSSVMVQNLPAAARNQMPFEARLRPYYVEAGEKKYPTTGVSAAARSADVRVWVETSSGGQVVVVGTRTRPTAAYSITIAYGSKSGRTFVSGANFNGNIKEILVK